MRDIPGIVWVLLGFFLLGGGVFIYSQTGPKPLPAVQGVWSSVENIRESLQFRRESLPQRGTKQILFPPYTVTLTRLPDIPIPEPAARYMLRVEPSAWIPIRKPWIAGGLTVALLDNKPQETIGNVKITVISLKSDTKVE